MQEHGVQRHGALRFLYHAACFMADGDQPIGNFPGIAHGGRKQQQGDARGKVDHGLFPHHAALLISQKVGLIQDHEIGGQRFPAVHGIVKLIAQDLGGSHDDRGMGVLLAVAGQDAHLLGAEMGGELNQLGVGQGFERRGIPGPAALVEDPRHGLQGNPGLACTGGGADQTVSLSQGFQGLELERIGHKGSGRGGADAGKNLFESGVGPRSQ